MLDRALLYRLTQDFIQAQSYLKETQDYVIPEDDSLVKYWQCIVDNEYLYSTNSITTEEFIERVEKCRYGIKQQSNIQAASYNEGELQVYPNPTNDKLYIQTKNLIIGKYYITTIAGHAVLQGSNTQQDFSVDVSTLPAGLYFLQLWDGKQQVVKKFVKE
jgi:hypothetical protein